MELSLGIDTGGTHTDFILVESSTGQVWTAKVATTPADPLIGILEGLELVLKNSGADISQLNELVYGTTIVVNMLIQHQTMETGLITTRGFRDVLEIGRAYRTGNIYDINFEKPTPLVQRDLRMEVDERMNFRGEVLKNLDEENCRAVVQALKSRGVKSIAVCLLHSYINPVSEQRVKAIIAEEYSAAYVSLSSEINPIFREYERTSTTVVNAHVTPSMIKHLDDFEARVSTRGLRGHLYTMQANGGKATFQSARQRPVNVINSGPIAGAIAGAYIARAAGFENAVTMDMGGTSCDVALIVAGEPKFATESTIEGYPVQIPTIDLNIVGAGGGSIAWLDSGGGLRVGPQSAGADPGPVCYSKGGRLPTVTDANLVTGRLNPDYYLNGTVKLDQELARRAIEEQIALPLGMSILEAAAGILEVANATMIRAIKLLSVERGYDPHDFALVAFGGAGPLHALRLAEELEFPIVIIPRYPGNTSALGLVLADVRHDYVATRIQLVENAICEDVEAAFQELEVQAYKHLEEEGLPPEQHQFSRMCDLRYFGQGFEVSVPVAGSIKSQADLDGIASDFHTAHRRAFGHAMDGDPVELVNFRVRAQGTRPQPELIVQNGRVGRTTDGNPHPAPSLQAALKGERDIYLKDRYFRCPVYDRAYLLPGFQLQGPAVVEQPDSTVLINPDCDAHIDNYGNLTITPQPEIYP
ncbi:MAG TPA: hydantoinase/oxoprolinase family protein [Anaerolineaceae bacterium]